VSIEAVMSRVSQLQAMLANGAPAAPPAATSTTSTSFSSALQSATTPTSIAPQAAAATAASPTSTSSSLPAGTPYAAEITQAATANGVDPALLAGLVKQESGFNPNAGSGAGARGLTQLMPGTASGLGVTNILDPVQNLNGGAKYLKQQLDAFGGDVTKALAAYNAGPGAVQRFGGVPPYSETQNYVRIVQANAAGYRVGSTTTPSSPSEI
jgi:soluble lytic murein transglycosylase-like protein